MKVGAWQVEPDLNRISRGEESITLPPKVMMALLLLARHAGQTVSRDLLMAELWPNQVVTDSSLYQAIASLRKSLGDTHQQRHYIERVSSRGYRLIAEVQYEDPLPTHTPAPEQPEPHRKGMLFGALAAALVLALIWALRDPEPYQSPEPPQAAEQLRPADIHSLAVMPFVGATQEGQQEGWAVALEDALLTQLARVERLQVIAGRGTSEFAPDAVLSGSVQQQEQALRVNLRLTRPGDRRVIWARQIDGEVSRLFELQDQVTGLLLALFEKSQTAPAFDPDTADPNVFSNYLLGRVLWSQRTPQSLTRAEKIFVSVIERAPDFAQAYVGLCDSYFFASIYRDWTLRQALEACSPLLEKALLLQPRLGEALATKALFLYEQGEEATAEALFEQAIQNAPNYAFARMWYGDLLRSKGELSRAREQQQLAMKLAPLSPIVMRHLAYVLLNQGKVVEARRVYRQALELEPDYSYRPVEEIEFFNLNVDRAVAFIRWSGEFPKYLERHPDLLLSMALVRLALGQQALCNELIAQAAASDGINLSFLHYARAVTAIAHGEHDKALEWFQRRMALGAHEQHFAFPYIAALHWQGNGAEALRFAERHLGGLWTNAFEVNRENQYQLISYVALLEDAGQEEKAREIAKRIDRFLEAELDVEDLNHLEWLSRRGRKVFAANKAMQLMQSGWLPNYSAAPYLVERMHKLLAIDKHEFSTLLETNRRRALEQLKLSRARP